MRGYRKQFKLLQDTIGEDSGLQLRGRSPMWETHGKHEVWSGQRLGRSVEVRLRLDNQKLVYARVRAQLGRPLSDGLTLEGDHAALKAFGFRRILVEGEDEHATLCFKGHDKLGLIGDLSRWDPGRDRGPMPTAQGERAHIVLRPDSMELGFRDVYTLGVDSLLDLVAALAEALEQEEDRPWQELQERYGLERQGERLHGPALGHALNVQYVGGQTRVQVGWAPGSLPADLVVRHKEHLEGQPVALANPVLGMLVAARTSDPVALDRALQDEELAGAVLAVVHAFPGSTVRSGRVELKAPGRLKRGLADAVEAALQAAEMLERAGR